jgi:hypothetical protein
MATLPATCQEPSVVPQNPGDEVPELPETVVEANRPAAGGFGGQTMEPARWGRGDDLLGLTGSASEGRFGQPEIELRPILRPGEVLELVPGLIATQHSGAGKANQFFVRGFNLDHGTDFAVRIDGVPINLPTHAHGQGYLDVNWLIPELVDYADYKLGPYYADVGDFSSAGALDLRLRRTLPHGIASLSGGAFNYYRLLVANSSKVARGDLLYAYEQNYYDGPWEVPQKYNRLNGVLKWTTGDDYEGLSLSALGYKGYWTATNQIAQRAVDAGFVGRFGSLDPTDGGDTSRTTLNAEYWRDDGRGVTKANAYMFSYNLDLYSNFTYFLEDPVNGDQIQQIDARVAAGTNISRTLEGEFATHGVGFQFRNDTITNVGLNHTAKRQPIETVRSDDVSQQNYGIYYTNSAQLTNWAKSNIGLRGDFYHFDVTSHTDPADSGDRDAAVFSPKTGLVFGPWVDTEYFINWGQSYHSNDARGVLASVDPATPLVKSDGSEVGLRSRLTPDWNTTLSLWYLELDSELVFAGDAGTNEPAGASHRTGFTCTNHWQVREWLTLDADYAYVKPRFVGGDRIPNSVNNVVSGGFTARQLDGGWYGTLRLRHFGPGALIEDNSARSSTTSLLNLQLGYQLPRLTMACDFFNILNRKDNDILYFYESQPAGLPAANDYHFHPVEPFMVRGHVTWTF